MNVFAKIAKHKLKLEDKKMKVLVTWERLAPDTVGGYRLKVTIIYMSFDKDEIDKLERNMGETIAIIIDNVELKEKESEE